MSALLCLLLAPVAVEAPPPDASPFAAAPVADAELAGERGGFRLPNGIDVALTVQTDTAVDGALVLRTVFRADHGTPTLSSYVPRDGATVGFTRTNAGGTGQAAPTISYDARGGIQVTPGATAVAAAIGTAKGAIAAIPEGLREAGNAVATDASGPVRTVTLSGGDLVVTHFAGNAFGSAIANSGSDRAIDTATTVSIDLGNAGPDVLGSAMLRVEGVALDALRMRP